MVAHSNLQIRVTFPKKLPSIKNSHASGCPWKHERSLSQTEYPSLLITLTALCCLFFFTPLCILRKPVIQDKQQQNNNTHLSFFSVVFFLVLARKVNDLLLHLNPSKSHQRLVLLQCGGCPRREGVTLIPPVPVWPAVYLPSWSDRICDDSDQPINFVMTAF